jgi:5-(carboxyamino)imidazole ribonucleotide synthase
MDTRTGLPVVGMVGGGQLARMTHQAAISLGQSLRVLAESPDDSAALVAADVRIGSHQDLAALREFPPRAAKRSLDHEHVPNEHIAALAAEGRDDLSHVPRHRVLCAQDQGPDAGAAGRAGRTVAVAAGDLGEPTSRVRGRGGLAASSPRPPAADTTGRGVWVLARRPRRPVRVAIRDPADRRGTRAAAPGARCVGGAIAVRAGRRVPVVRPCSGTAFASRSLAPRAGLYRSAARSRPSKLGHRSLAHRARRVGPARGRAVRDRRRISSTSCNAPRTTPATGRSKGRRDLAVRAALRAVLGLPDGLGTSLTAPRRPMANVLGAPDRRHLIDERLHPPVRRT